MARFTTALSQTFRRSRARPADVVREMLLPAVESTLDDADDCQRGPGWFDSSWDLQHGLEVREGLPGDPQLNEWIEACLRSASPLGAQAASISLPASMSVSMPASTQPLPQVRASADRPCDWALV